MRTLDDFTYATYARAVRRIHDANGTYAPRGSVGEICDRLPCDGPHGYLVVDFPQTGPLLCEPEEVHAA